MERIAGKYELVRLIGRGGMGSVWEARHVTLGTRVAIKFIESDLADSSEARRRFETEARAAASLESRYAIRVHDHGVTDDGRPFIVMELLVGESLASRAARGVLPLADAAGIVQQIARGLAQAHERGIVHRDLKLENVFLAHGDDEEIAKVLDFGIAKIIPSQLGDPNDATTTRAGALLGTPFYMSPEQARASNVDPRSDLWSLGVLVYRCVLGRFPFEGASIGDLLVKICVEPAPTPTAIDASLPPTFDAWMERALSRDPAARFGSAREMADALSAVAGVTPNSHRAPPPELALARTLPSLPPLAMPTPIAASATLAPPRPRSRVTTYFAIAAAVVGFAIGSWRVTSGTTHAAASAPAVAADAPPPATLPIAVAPAASAAASSSPSAKAAASAAPARRARHADIELAR